MPPCNAGNLACGRVYVTVHTNALVQAAKTARDYAMKRMLFNATHPEELRVAIVDGQKLLDLDIESSHHQQKKGNIYLGRVTRVEPSLEAAFVDYGVERQGFLPLKEISRTYFTDFSPRTPMAQVKIQDVIKEGQQLLVQVEKDERGNKGAALTTFISLAGRFLVLMPNNPKGGGISRRIEGEQRTELRESLSGLNLPTEHAIIARTAGIGKSQEELQWDLDFLLQLWEAIVKASQERPAPFLVYQETNLVVRAIRDYLRNDIAEIIIDDQEIHERASRFMSQVMPHNLVKLKLYQDSVPLFSRFQIEHQIESAFSREVRLPSGGALIIDHTEALVTIDVNSARATKGADIEETALQTNLEAADELSRQLRIRDLGGLIVIDFIDMTSNRNQRTVENRLQDALKSDRARVQIGRISRFGILEMSRQRLRASLGESNYEPCPRCEGTGYIRSVKSSALNILRILEEEALKENTEAIHAHLPAETASILLNEKRHELSMIENRLGTSIWIMSSDELETPQFRIHRLKSEDLASVQHLQSFEVEMEEEAEVSVRKAHTRTTESERAAVGLESMQVSAPPVSKPAVTKSGFFTRLFNGMFGTEPEPEQEKKTAATQSRGEQQQQRRKPNRRRGGQSGKRSQPARRDAQNQTAVEAEDSIGSDRRPGGRRRRGRGRKNEGRDAAAGNRGQRGSNRGGNNGASGKAHRNEPGAVVEANGDRNQPEEMTQSNS